MGGTRILIVEDEILVAREIEGHLQEMGYEVMGIALEGESVLQQLTEPLPDLVLMDINLQGEQDGIAIAQEIHVNHQIPVVYVTAYADPNTLERAKLTDPFGYVLKPFTEQSLRVAIELALFRHREGATVETDPPSETDPPTETVPPTQTDSPTETEAALLINGLPPSKLQKVLDYIQENLNQALSLPELAQETGLTASYFARLFKQSTGKSVHQYVIGQRVARAQTLLRQTEATIAEIAAACGFANPSHLSLHFKRIVGVTPKRFRFF